MTPARGDRLSRRVAPGAHTPGDVMPDLPKADTPELVFLSLILAELQAIRALLAPTPAPSPVRARKVAA